MWWFVGDEEINDQFVNVGFAGFGLYHMAGSWCMSQIRGRPEAEVPAEWFIPDWVIRGWGAQRVAHQLCAEGLFTRLQGGYSFGWIRSGNTPDAVRRKRKADREKPSRQAGRAS
jgi:hypothetical protein